MKNFLLFSLLVVASTVWGQEVPSGNNFTEITNNYKAELGTGNFVYAVPLFDVATASPDFNFSGSMYYNAQAASSVYTTEGILSKGWSVDFLPSIYRNIDKDDTLWDESYYMPNTADVYGDGTPFDRPDRVNDLFEFSAFGLKGSFRLVYNSNNTIDVNIVDSNAYIEIIPDATMSSGNGDGKNIDLLGFTIKDKNGFSYNFNSVETSAIMIGISSSSSSYQAIADLAGIDSNGYNLYKRAFLLGSVTDKYSRELVQFVYKTYPWSASYLNKTVSYDQKVIDKVVFPNTGSLVFNTIQSKINSIILQDFDNQQLSKVTFSTSSVNFYDKNNVLEEHYGFTYNSTLNTNKDKTNNYGNYLNTEDCFDPSTLYNNEIQRYDAGLLKTITLPHKGKVNIEYEVNTFSTTTPSESYTNKNERNYNYVPVPVTNNPFTKKYSFYLEQITNYTNEGYYVKYDSQLYTSPLLDENGQPFKMYPYLEIRTGSNNYLFQNFLYEKQCTKGEEIYHVGLYTSPLVNSTVYLNPLSGYESYISNVQVFKKTLKPEEERVKFLYGPSVRVKKITVTGITNEIISETDYSYQDPEDDKKSSGFSPEILWDSFGNRRVATYKPFPIFYKYVTISETGKGKTVYELNSGQFQNNKLGIPEV